MIYHLIAFISGFILDLILGDPYFFPHPVRLIGNAISLLENHFLGKRGEEIKNKSRKRKRVEGIITVFIICGFSMMVSAVLLIMSYSINLFLGCIIETIMTYQLLAAKCLKVESMKVYDRLKNGTLEEARKAVSMIVGRDTENLTEDEVARAVVETVAENTSDGEIAPMFYLFLGGPVLGFFYKAVNTMDSMIGYKNERFMDFGKCAARTDDFVNFIPSRLSALFMIVSCLVLGKNFDFKNAVKIFLRDRFNHASPNSAQTESVCAGALGLRLAGPTKYEGKMEEKPFIGDDYRRIEAEDIKNCNKLLYTSSVIGEIIFSGFSYVIYLLIIRR